MNKAVKFAERCVEMPSRRGKRKSHRKEDPSSAHEKKMARAKTSSSKGKGWGRGSFMALKNIVAFEEGRFKNRHFWLKGRGRCEKRGFKGNFSGLERRRISVRGVKKNSHAAE